MTEFNMLVVEDDAQLREAIIDTLTLQKITCFEAASAEDAIKILKRKSVNMILSDISMGELSGFDLLNHVKSHYPMIPMVLMTAFGEVEKFKIGIWEKSCIGYFVIVNGLMLIFVISFMYDWIQFSR